MDSIGIVIYCQGFMLPKPFGYMEREMGLCDLSGKNRRVFAYENTGPCYETLSDVTKQDVEKACEQHGVPYEAEHPARAETCLTSDFDEFVTKYASKPNVGVWAGDEVGQAFLTGMGCPSVVIEHHDLQSLPLGCVLAEDTRYRNRHCSGHWLRKCIDDEDSHLHRCSLEYACALSALVRKETHYRSPTILEDLLYEKNLWQARVERLLDVMMCSSECACEMSHAFDQGEGLEWYSDCDTSPCCFIKRIFREGVHEPYSPYYRMEFPDRTLDTLTVLTPPKDEA